MSTRKYQSNNINRFHRKSHNKSKRLSAKYSISSSGYVPRYEIINQPSSASLIVYLKSGQSIIDRYGYMNYFDSSIKLNVKMIKGITGAFKFISGGDAFENIYTGTTSQESKICLGPNIPGDIIPIIITPGESYTFDSDNLLCYSSNIKFETTFRFKNILGGGDVMLKSASIINGDKGIIWLYSHGSYQKLHVENGKSIKVETGFFIVANSKFRYNIAKLGNLKSMMFSGEGSMYMEFTGPGIVYIHSRNRKRELKELQKTLGISKS